MSPHSSALSPPVGFEPFPMGGEFAHRSGLLHAKWEKEHFVVGFRVADAHMNPTGSCHGGMLTTVADVLLATCIHYQSGLGRIYLPTISLNVDFLAGAVLGDWVEGRADVLKMTRNLIFSTGLLEVDGKPILRANGIFKRGPVMPDVDVPVLAGYRG